MRAAKITIVRLNLRRPVTDDFDVNQELQLLGGALGLYSSRDKDKAKFRIFVFLLRSLRRGRRGLTSDELADRLGLSRATVLHHIRGLIDAGIVEQYLGRYQLTVDSLEELIVKLRSDVNRTLDDLQELARHCDTGLGLH